MAAGPQAMAAGPQDMIEVQVIFNASKSFVTFRLDSPADSENVAKKIKSGMVCDAAAAILGSVVSIGPTRTAVLQLLHRCLLAHVMRLDTAERPLLSYCYPERSIHHTPSTT